MMVMKLLDQSIILRSYHTDCTYTTYTMSVKYRFNTMTRDVTLRDHREVQPQHERNEKKMYRPCNNNCSGHEGNRT